MFGLMQPGWVEGEDALRARGASARRACGSSAALSLRGDAARSSAGRGGVVGLMPSARQRDRGAAEILGLDAVAAGAVRDVNELAMTVRCRSAMTATWPVPSDVDAAAPRDAAAGRSRRGRSPAAAARSASGRGSVPGRAIAVRDRGPAGTAGAMRRRPRSRSPRRRAPQASTAMTSSSSASSSSSSTIHAGSARASRASRGTAALGTGSRPATASSDGQPVRHRLGRRRGDVPPLMSSTRRPG